MKPNAPAEARAPVRIAIDPVGNGYLKRSYATTSPTRAVCVKQRMDCD